MTKKELKTLKQKTQALKNQPCNLNIDAVFKQIVSLNEQPNTKTTP